MQQLQLLHAALGVDVGASTIPGGTPSPAAAVVLAPMVRLGTLPLRLLALERGASLVYTEEVLDVKLAATERRFDARLGTMDWRGAGGQCILRTCQREAGRLVVQLGTSGDTATLLAAAKLLLSDEPEQDPEPVADADRHRYRDHGIVAVDINLGCPKRVARSGGTGAALFANRERCETAVRALREFLPPTIAVTCKVRLCADVAESLERCRGLAAAGAALICVHARRASERPRDSCRWAEVRALRLGLENHQGAVAPLLVANGDALDGSAVAELRETSGCSVVAVGRGALSAGNVFGPHELKPVAADPECATLTMCRRYAQIAIDLENNPLNTAFVLQWMIHTALQDGRQTPTAAARLLQDAAAALRNATTSLGVAQAVGLESFYSSVPARGSPAPPSHRYSPDYFDNLDTRSDWAAGPTFAAVAEMRMANAAIDSKPELKRSNDDFRRLAAAAVAMRGRNVDNSGQGGGPTSQKRRKIKRKKQEEDSKAALLRRQQCIDTGGSTPRYFVLQQSDPAEKQLGYFAPAWRCKCVVAGVPYEGGWGKSKLQAEQNAAKVALQTLPALEIAPNAAAIAARVAPLASVTGASQALVPAALLMPRAVRGRLNR